MNILEIEGKKYEVTGIAEDGIPIIKGEVTSVTQDGVDEQGNPTISTIINVPAASLFATPGDIGA